MTCTRAVWARHETSRSIMGVEAPLQQGAISMTYSRYFEKSQRRRSGCIGVQNERLVSCRALWLALASMTFGCGSGFTMQPPSTFVELEESGDSHYELRTTSAQGVVMGVREIDNDQHGTLDFWVEAIRNRVRSLGGYAVVIESDVHAASGEAGKQIRFGHDEDGVPFSYWVTIFVTESHVFLVEVGGRREPFEQAQAQVEASLAQFRID